MTFVVQTLRRCLLLALLGLVGCSSTSAPPPEAPKASVRHPERRELIDFAEFNGWLQADETQEVRARVRGHIHKVHFTNGQMVKKGDLLFELDPRPFQAALDAAKGQMSTAEANLELANKEYSRTASLVKSGAASREEVDVWTAKKTVRAAEKVQAQASIEQAKLDLEYARITADIDGRIGKAQLTEGNLVNAGGSDPLLTTIVGVDPIRVAFNVDERLLQQRAQVLGEEGKTLTSVLAALKDAKTPFTFAQDGEREFKHQGTLAFGDNRIDPGTGTIQAYGTADNKDGRYLPGARVRVRVPIGGKANPALLVPETAILADQDKRYVLIVDDQNVVRRRNVNLGLLTDDGMRAIQPADKLAAGEKPESWWVLVDNLQRARLNYPLEPQKPAAAKSAP
ncbi:MAG: efflux RND transporter periplasmic adaptor subunit [Planctomycetia bacterium]|nr:efflux RND transporter periplasmic adaptor subunit [Planctomycetia bacterium]